MDAVRRSIVKAFGSLAVLSVLLAACNADEPTATEPAAPRGVYALENAEGGDGGDILVISFFDAERYWVWKNREECRDLSALQSGCEEWGRYAIVDKTLTLTPDDQTPARTYPLELGPPVSATITSSSSPQAGVGLVEGSGSLVGGGGPLVRPVAANLSIRGRVVRLVESAGQLLTCQHQEHPSGEVPGAAYPSTIYRNGVFNSGPFAPGGRYNPATAPAGEPNLYRSSSAQSHEYAFMSDLLPAGTTFQEAANALQRFNAPTEAALSGRGNDPNAGAAWVVDPVTGHIPVGCVSVEHGSGWVRMTTQSIHPFVGTITRYVVRAGGCRYRILTIGDGRTPSDNTAEGIVSGARNLANIVGGPTVFAPVNRNLIESIRPANPGGGC